MVSVKTGAAVAVLSVAFAPIAHASDLPEPLPAVQAPILESLGGWYLRGDFGYRWNKIGSQTAIAPFTSPSSGSLDNGWWGGGGVGLKARWLRADITVDYAPQVRYTGTTLTPNDTTSKVDSISTLFNIYFDLGTWWAFTPYVGAGIGAAYLRTSDVFTPQFVDAGGNKWNLSYAGMAGASYAIAPNIAVDIGYRYLHLGDVGSNTGAMSFSNINAHELRLGLRWMFNDVVTIP